MGKIVSFILLLLGVGSLGVGVYASLDSLESVEEPNLEENFTFTIDGQSYQFEEGMTWKTWVNSDYNLGGVFMISFDVINTFEGSQVVNPDGTGVMPYDKIIANCYYEIMN